MKIQKGTVIQERLIKRNTDKEFLAIYKGKEITITTDHDYGRAKYPDETRYDVVVQDLKTGDIDVNTLHDTSSMKEAIKFALKGAQLT